MASSRDSFPFLFKTDQALAEKSRSPREIWAVGQGVEAGYVSDVSRESRRTLRGLAGDGTNSGTLWLARQ